ncbi:MULTISPECIES: sporulation histidine kinase inhibitor Sda [unclassified Bacillus (in: firmicutes)]|uniref:sporulation histidine kinase inhibitor Sda n=1 Tax=unclassified Bacillus (in: firmicutes) TaxID=185979 RepID=UPI001BE67AD3|nr:MULTISPECIES: sporulation histidine kinase inhibitor Sda [unclassified Bacillus (in: firmicutes)]MBT2617243.1 sporulation histidine kinase inhibitor Sda [Bacillus sp. ISL-78]MBT2627822.1 sporulation histidine kinase inhibitor Sda [Bacillus sp. ISL-101]
MLQRLSDEFLINTYVKALNLEIDPNFISLLNEEIYRRFGSHEKHLSNLNLLIRQ